jgi:hypothetical protein
VEASAVAVVEYTEGLLLDPGLTSVVGLVPSASETGQTVVETAIVSVTTAVVCDTAGQSSTLTAHDIIVDKVVEYTVEVVISIGAVVTGEPSVELDSYTGAVSSGTPGTV